MSKYWKMLTMHTRRSTPRYAAGVGCSSIEAGSGEIGAPVVPLSAGAAGGSSTEAESSSRSNGMAVKRA